MSQYLIGTVTVGAGGQATIQFNSIAQNFTDLMLTMSLRGSSNPTSTSIADGYVTLNGSESSKTGRLLFGQGSGAGASGSYTNLNIWYPSSGATATTFGNAVINIPNYSSGTNKALSIDMVSESNETFTYGMMFAGLWANTAAVTSITLTASGTTWAAGSTASLYGIKNLPASIAKATGGAITFDANYVYHAFTGSGTFTPTTALSADVLIIAGGGSTSNGSPRAGGGGAGGVLYQSNFNFSTTGYPVTVGAGASAVTGNLNGLQGNVSTISTLTAVGGGYAGGYEVTSGVPTGGNGGSGGGAGVQYLGPVYQGGAGTAGQGFAGGAGLAEPVGGWVAGGGGGGAGGVGTAASGNSTAGSTQTPGNGGPGTNAYATWHTATGTGVSGYIGGGGAGGGINSGGSNIYGAAGVGGGGSNSGGTANTGGGAGSGGYAGGSGIVIIRYAR